MRLLIICLAFSSFMLVAIGGENQRYGRENWSLKSAKGRKPAKAAKIINLRPTDHDFERINQNLENLHLFSESERHAQERGQVLDERVGQ
jgi:hypothetical protein